MRLPLPLQIASVLVSAFSVEWDGRRQHHQPAVYVFWNHSLWLDGWIDSDHRKKDVRLERTK
jgi:hypothetical protein